MPTTKIPVPHDAQFKGIVRNLPSYLNPPDSWFMQFGMRRDENGLSQVPRKGGFQTVTNGDFDSTIPPGTLPPKKNKTYVEGVAAPTFTISLKVKTTEALSFACWSTDKVNFQPIFAILNEYGETLYTSSAPLGLEELPHFFSVLTVTLSPGNYSIVVRSLTSESGAFVFMTKGGPERTEKFGDTPVTQLAACYSSNSDTLYFLAAEDGEMKPAALNVYGGRGYFATTGFVDGEFVPILLSDSTGAAYCVWSDGTTANLGLLGSTTNWRFPTGVVPVAGVAGSTYLHFWDQTFGRVWRFHLTNKTFDYVDQTYGGLAVVGKMTYLNGYLYRFSQMGLLKLNESLAVQASYALDLLDLVFVPVINKFYGFLAGGVVKRYSLVFAEELTLFGVPPCYVNQTTKLLSYLTSNDGIENFVTTCSVSYEDEELSELQMLDYSVGPVGVVSDPIAVWIPSIGRLAVVSAGHDSTRINFVV